MAEANVMFPNLNVRNTFLHFELPEGSAQVSRSFSCPAWWRLSTSQVDLVEVVVEAPLAVAASGSSAPAMRQGVAAAKAQCTAAAAGAVPVVASTKKVAAAVPAARTGKASSGASRPVLNIDAQASSSSAQTSAASKSASPKIEKQIAIAAVPKGRPPYEPKLATGARGEKACADENGWKVAGRPAKASTQGVIASRGSESVPQELAPKAEAWEEELEAEAFETPSIASAPNGDNDEWAVVKKGKKRSGIVAEVASSAGGKDQQVQKDVTASSRSLQGPLHRQLEVGIEDELEFRVVKRLIGPSGSNIDRIRGDSYSTKIELRGVGTKSLGDTSGPLVIHIKGTDAVHCAKALDRATELVAEVHRDYEAFVASRLTGAVPNQKTTANSDVTEESTSADDCAAGQDGTDSEVDDPLAGDLMASRSQVSLEGASSSEDWQAAKATGRGARQRPTKHSDAIAPASPLTISDVRSSGTKGGCVHHEVPVGIKHTYQFPAVRRLIGVSGQNMKDISNACPGTKVELRGAGTNPWSGGESGPLVLHIRGFDADACESAREMANALVEKVRKEHQRFLDTGVLS